MHRTMSVERPDVRRDIRESILAYDELREMGCSVPRSALSDDAYVALLLIASGAPGHRIIVDAYTHAGGDWVVEVHGYPWQECRYTPAGWQTMYERYLAEAYRGGQLLILVWIETYQQIAGERPNGMMLDPREQWAKAPPAPAPATGGAA
jgi:hypothetical protein